jgi:hypothetical protein
MSSIRRGATSNVLQLMAARSKLHGINYIRFFTDTIIKQKRDHAPNLLFIHSNSSNIIVRTF